MSKFFPQRGNESESESGEESEANEEQVVPQTRFANFDDSSSDEDKGPRTVRTVVSRQMDNFKTTLVSIKNHLKINDYSSIQDDFTNLSKILEKSKQLIEKEGIPKIYFKTLVLIEDAIEETDKKKLGTVQIRAWNTMKNKIKKHNREYADQIQEYRKNPLASEEEDNSKDEEDSKEKPKSKPKKYSKDEDEDEDEEDENQDKDEEESSEEEIHDRMKMTPQERRLKVRSHK
jgi:translation initiation factor 3 subunit C